MLCDTTILKSSRNLAFEKTGQVRVGPNTVSLPYFRNYRGGHILPLGTCLPYKLFTLEKKILENSISVLKIYPLITPHIWVWWNKILAVQGGNWTCDLPLEPKHVSTMLEKLVSSLHVMRKNTYLYGKITRKIYGEWNLTQSKQLCPLSAKGRLG